MGSSKEASEHLFVSLVFYCSVMKQTALECEERSSRVVSGTRQVATGNLDVKDPLKCETGTVMGRAFVPPMNSVKTSPCLMFYGGYAGQALCHNRRSSLKCPQTVGRQHFSAPCVTALGIFCPLLPLSTSRFCAARHKD